MAERHEKAKKDRSIQTFKELQKTAIFLNYDLRCVSKILFIRNKLAAWKNYFIEFFLSIPLDSIGEEMSENETLDG